MTPLSSGTTLGFAAAVALVGLLGRRRMPPGLGEGTVVAAVSGGVVLLFAIDSTGRLARPMLGHVLTALTVFWYAVGWMVARREPFRRGGREDVGDDSAARERSRVWAYAALVCGLGALVNGLSTPAGFRMAGWPAASADFVGLLLVAVLTWVFRGGPWAVYPVAALLVCLLVVLLPSDEGVTHATAVGVAMNGIGLALVVVVIGTVVVRWWRRRGLWLQDPQRLAEPPPSGDTLFASLVGISVLLGVAGVVLREAALTPTAVLLAALTCLIIAHLRTWLIAGEIGLLLVAEGIVTASMAWLRPGWSGALFGVSLSGIYLLWLARFWEQQLKERRPWTTAGRLTPIARRLAYAACVGAVALAGGGISTGDFQTQPIWIAAVTVLLLLGAMSWLVRDSDEHRRPHAAFAACLVVLAAGGPAGRLLSDVLGVAVSPVILIAAGALLLALRVALTPRTPPTAAAYNAYLGGVLPVIALFALTLRGLDSQTAIVLILTAGTVMAALKSFRAPPQAAQAECNGPD